MRRSELVWSAPIATRDVPESGLKVELKADEPTRAAIAKAAHVNRIDQLEARFDIVRCKPDGLRAVGTVSAKVEQKCVVSLEPLVNEVVEDVEVTFSPEARTFADESGAKGVDLQVEAADPPEPLIDGVIDLGAVATEFLILGVDPYPRRAGAVFEAPRGQDTGGGPFAALAVLKGNGSKD